MLAFRQHSVACSWQIAAPAQRSCLLSNLPMRACAGRRDAVRSWVLIGCAGIVLIEWALYAVFFVLAPLIRAHGEPRPGTVAAQPMGSLPIRLDEPIGVLGLNVASAMVVYGLQDAWAIHVSAMANSLHTAFLLSRVKGHASA